LPSQASADRFQATAVDNTGGGAASSYDYADTASHGIWIPLVAVIAGSGSASSSTTIHTGAGSGSTNSTARTFDSPPVAAFDIGEAMNGASDLGSSGTDSRVAEFALWNSALSTPDITSFLTGTAASSISSGTLITYFPLRTDANKGSGSDSLASLTVAGATNDSGDHPTITSGTSVARLAAYYAMMRQ
jgi:hypothetical protein